MTAGAPMTPKYIELKSAAVIQAHLLERAKMVQSIKTNIRTLSVSARYGEEFDTDSLLVAHEIREREMREKREQAAEREKDIAERREANVQRKRERETLTCRGEGCRSWYDLKRAPKKSLGFQWCDYCDEYGVCPTCYKNPDVIQRLAEHEAECERAKKRRRLEQEESSSDDE